MTNYQWFARATDGSAKQGPFNTQEEGWDSIVDKDTGEIYTDSKVWAVKITQELGNTPEQLTGVKYPYQVTPRPRQYSRS
jgi:hypothetical protein